MIAPIWCHTGSWRVNLGRALQRDSHGSLPFNTNALNFMEKKVLAQSMHEVHGSFPKIKE